jgi:hypothetical protein
MSEFLTKEIYVRGVFEPVTLHSCDGSHWFFSQTEAAAYQRRREAFLAEEARLLRKHSTFSTEKERPIGRKR